MKTLKVKSGLKAGALTGNHSSTKTLKVKSGLKAGGVWGNHNATKLKVKTHLEAGRPGGWDANHNGTRARL